MRPRYDAGGRESHHRGALHRARWRDRAGGQRRDRVVLDAGSEHHEQLVVDVDCRGRPILAITKTGPARAVVGQAVAFDITVRNLGPSAVAAFTIDDPTPAGLSLVATTGACSAGFPCTTGPLPVGQSPTTTATYRVEAGASGTVLTNTATVSTPTPELTTTNNTATATTTLSGDSDTDADLLPDGCEQDAGLPPGSTAGGDDDGDGVTNIEECDGGTHPRGFVQQYLPEGATGSFYNAQLTLENVAEVAAHVLIHYEPEGEPEEHAWLLLPAGARTTLSITSFLGIASFATRVESDVAISLERTMTWMEGGGHADIATSSLSTSWFFAEGATTGEFILYYLLQNPNAQATDVDVTFLVDGGAPVVKVYTLPPNSRTSIWVNSIPELASANISLAIHSRSLPIAAARAMYRDWNGQLHTAGGSASGSGAGSLDWYFAEGATSTFFDTWLLLANPDLADAPVEIAYYTSAGTVVVRSMVVPAQRRVTVRVNDVDPSLANADVAMRVHATGGIPVIAERSMWWPSPNYYEGHQSSGARQPAPIWRFGQGLVEAGSETYVLIANYAATAGQALLTVFFDNGETSVRILGIGATSRTTVNLGTLFPEAAGRRFHFEVASVGPSLALVAERSIYRNVHGRAWGMGTSLVGTPVNAITLPPAEIPAGDPGADAAIGAEPVVRSGREELLRPPRTSRTERRTSGSPACPHRRSPAVADAPCVLSGTAAVTAKGRRLGFLSPHWNRQGSRSVKSALQDSARQTEEAQHQRSCDSDAVRVLAASRCYSYPVEAVAEVHWRTNSGRRVATG